MSNVCKTYLGRFDRLVVVDVGDRAYPLPHIVHHSPTGYAWGYAGSGPADLALSILADYFEEPAELVLGHVRSMWAPRSKAACLYQPFKFAFLTRPDRDLKISSLEIEAWIALSNNAAALQALAALEVDLAEIRRLDGQEALQGADDVLAQA